MTPSDRLCELQLHNKLGGSCCFFHTCQQFITLGNNHTGHTLVKKLLFVILLDSFHHSRCREQYRLLNDE